MANPKAHFGKIPDSRSNTSQSSLHISKADRRNFNGNPTTRQWVTIADTTRTSNGPNRWVVALARGVAPTLPLTFTRKPDPWRTTNCHKLPRTPVRGGTCIPMLGNSYENHGRNSPWGKMSTRPVSRMDHASPRYTGFLFRGAGEPAYYE